MTVRSPWDGSRVATINTTTLEEADKVLDRARVAFEAFRWTPAWKRSQILERASHLIEENAEQIARIIAAEGGKPLKDSRVEVKRGASTTSAGRAKRPSARPARSSRWTPNRAARTASAGRSASRAA